MGVVTFHFLLNETFSPHFIQWEEEGEGKRGKKKKEKEKKYEYPKSKKFLVGSPRRTILALQMEFEVSNPFRILNYKY